MSEPKTKTGRDFLSGYIDQFNPDALDAFDPAMRIGELKRTILAIEAEAVAAYLASAEGADRGPESHWEHM